MKASTSQATPPAPDRDPSSTRGCGKQAGYATSRALILLASLLILPACKKESPPEVEPAASPVQATKPITPDWPITRGGPALQGRVHAPVPQSPAIDWTYDLEAPAMAEATVAEQHLVVGDIMGLVHCLDLETRKLLWSHETDDTIQAAPALSNNRVFVGSGDNTFLALDLKTGDELWSIQGDEKFPSAPVVTSSADGKSEWVLVNGYDGIARCLDASNGEAVWSYKTDNYINGTPAIIDETHVAFGGCDKVIHVIKLSDGTLTNEVTTDAEIISSVATFGKIIYCTTYAHQLVATLADGDSLDWIYEAEDFPFSSAPAINEQVGHVYVGSKDKHLHAVDTTTGELLWRFRTGGPVESSPLVFDDAIVFGSNDGRLYAVTFEGKELWTLDLGEKLSAPAIFAQNRLIVTGAKGTVFVIK
ncbi:PQQ-binding-like beta-propeller repeat protein [Haloferula chungangensis]|uniref:PQQ-binding-like beta-propeller repeat protein n=1 Tax=Haloferula chungangensis TaxID=1048331 RepID=A0ABW2LAG6_9BACT